MKQPGDNELRELMWRPSLTAAEEARVKQLLDSQADAQAAFEEEARLNQLLKALPDAPLASNFTACVLQAVELEKAKLSRQERGWPAWRVGFGWVSRLAMAGFILAAGLFSFHKYQSNQRVELAQSIVSFSNVAEMPADWLRDFETIRNLSSASAVDDELLAALR